MKTSLRTTLLLSIFISFLAYNFDVENQQRLENNLRVLTITDSEIPDLPDIPFNYEDFDFPEHLQQSMWGETDTSVVDFVSNEGAMLGRVLFYDNKLSALENISCASCHAQEFSFADDKPFSEGVTIPTKRNSLQLNDLGWSNRMGFFWDLSQTDMQEMIKLPLKDANEVGADIPEVIAKLNDTEYYPELFQETYGDPEINEERIVDAISQFISSMVTFNSKRDQFLSGQLELSNTEMEGMHLFESTCAMCHFDGGDIGMMGIQLFEFPFIFSNGLPDVTDPGMGAWMGEEFNGLFKIPTLRNIEKTGPYMHDGRFETLEEVVDFYSDEVEPNEWTFMIPPEGFQFTEEQKNALVQFMKTFTDDSFLTNPKWSNPFRNSNTTSIEEFIIDNNISVSPNPFNDVATIEFSNDNNESVTIFLVDSQGKIVLKDEISDTKYLLEKNNLIPGIYFLDIVKANRTSSVKIIVQ